MNGRRLLRIALPTVAVTVIALALGFFVLGSGQPVSSAATYTETATAAPDQARAVAASADARVRNATPAATPQPVRARPRPRRHPAVAPGVPPAVRRALAAHRVVVVSLRAPRVALDELALAEARAGAAAAGAGFVALNVRNEREMRPLTALLGVPDDPTVLVFERPSKAFVQMPGFVDRETVAQAAANAAA